MIQSILAVLVTLWILWGLANVLLGVAQIFWGIAYGIAAVSLYTLALVIEFPFRLMGICKNLAFQVGQPSPQHL